MTGSLLTSSASDYVQLWQDYWANVWHVPVPWEARRLACFMTAPQGRQDQNARGDALVSDYPKGRRPFLGVVTNSGSVQASNLSGILEYNDAGHLLTIAPTRAGKGASQIVPNLLLYAGSCLVIDIKGENYDLTAKHRKTLFEGSQVLKFAPFEDDSNRYNPLDFIRVDPDGRPISLTFDDTRLLAEMLIPNRSGDSFWDTEARGLLTTILFYVATRYKPGDWDRTMRTVTEILFPKLVATDKSPIDQSIELMRREAEETDNEILDALITQFIEHEDKVRAGILSTCRSAMSIWLSDRLKNVTSRSDFRFSDLKRSMCRPPDQNPAPTTLYVTIPPEFLREYRSVLRMIVGLASVELTRLHDWATPENLAVGWWAKPPCPVLFLLDEFPSLGHMAPIEQGVAYLAGYGVQIWTFAQSIGQLKEIYKENWSTFVSNAGASSYFGITDPELCDFLSQQLGKTGEYALRYETRSETEGTSYGSSNTSSYNRSTNYGGIGQSSSDSTSRGDTDTTSDGSNSSTTIAEQLRFKDDPVAMPSDLRALPEGVQIVLLRNRRPVISNLLRFYDCELFGSLYGSWRD